MMTIQKVPLVIFCIIFIVWVWYTQYHIDRLEKKLYDNYNMLISVLNETSMLLKTFRNGLDNIENIKSEREDEENEDNGYLDVGDNSKS